MDLLKDIDEYVNLQEAVEEEILAAVETRKQEADKQPRLGLSEALPGGYETRGEARAAERGAAAELAVGAEQERAQPTAAVRTQAGKLLPVKVHQARGDGSMVIELRGRYYLAPAQAVQDQDVQGRPMKVVDATQVQVVS